MRVSRARQPGHPSMRRPLVWLTAAGGLLALGACVPLAMGDDDDDAAAGPQARQCIEHCGATADCNPGFECQGGRCVYTGTVSTPRCTDDASCTPILSGWLELASCSQSTACVYGQCVVVAGQGHCAMPPPCTAPTVEVSWPGLDGSEVTVCGKVGYRCSSGECWKPCSATSCAGATPLCGADGRCRCQDQSCDGNLAGTVCLASGACGCQSGADCPADTTDACYGGVCGCGSAAVCTEPIAHVSTTWVCEVP